MNILHIKIYLKDVLNVIFGQLDKILWSVVLLTAFQNLMMKLPEALIDLIVEF